jgi:hypothetical protein
LERNTTSIQILRPDLPAARLQLQVRPGLRGAGDQTRGVGAGIYVDSHLYELTMDPFTDALHCAVGGHQGSDVAARALSEPCRQALTHPVHPPHELAMDRWTANPLPHLVFGSEKQVYACVEFSLYK